MDQKRATASGLGGIGVRLLALGTAAYSVAELWGGLSSTVDPHLNSLMIVTSGLAIASVALFAIPQRRWTGIAFSGACAVAGIFAAIEAFAVAPQLTAWVLPMEMFVLTAAGFLHLARKTAANATACVNEVSILFSAMCALFGTVHFLNVSVIADMIPRWFPLRDILPFATGAILLSAGAALLMRWSRSGAAITIASMFASWIVLVHGPRLIAKPSDPGEWAFAALALALTGALLVLFIADLAIRTRARSSEID